MFPDTKRCLLCNNIWRCLERCLEHTLWGNCCRGFVTWLAPLKLLKIKPPSTFLKTPFLWELRQFKPLTQKMDSPTKERNKPSTTTEVVPGSQGGWDGMDGDPQRSGTQGAGSKVGKEEGVRRWMQRVVRLDKKKQIGSFLGFGYILLKNV